MPAPQILQGILNRILTSVIVPNFPQLSVTAPYMSKSLVQLTFDGNAVDQIGTATGIVNSRQPYVMANLTVSLLRSQSVAAAYLAQWQIDAVLGSVTVYSDSTTLPGITLNNCSMMEIDPGAFDGQDPATKVTLKGQLFVNSAMWANS